MVVFVTKSLCRVGFARFEVACTGQGIQIDLGEALHSDVVECEVP